MTLPSADSPRSPDLANIWLTEFRRAISQTTEQIFAEHAATTASYDDLAAGTHQALRQLVGRSEGMGSTFVLAVVRGFEGDWREALLVAAAIELLADAILVTDDVIDCDSLRWGEPSLHATYAAFARRREWRDPERFGRAIAAIGSDLLTSLAYMALATAPINNEVRGQVVSTLAEGQWRTDLSQIVDLRFEQVLPSAQEWETMASNRAAAHVQTSLVAGALIAGVDNQDVQAFRRFGHHLGLLYDIRADLLDTFGRPTPRRAVGRDMAMRKKPLFLCAAADAASPEERNRITQAFNADPIPVEKIARLVGDRGIASAVQRMATCAAACREAVEQTGLSEDGRQFFLTITERASSTRGLERRKR